MRIKLTVEHSNHTSSPTNIRELSQGFASITDEQPRPWQDNHFLQYEDCDHIGVERPYYVASTVIDVPTSAYAMDVAALAKLAGIPVNFTVGLFGIDDNNPDNPARLLIHMVIDVSETHKISQYIATIAYHH